MNTRNTIGTVKLELNFDSSLSAQQFEQHAWDWSLNNLLPALERVLDRYISADTVVVIEKMTLNMGSIPNNNVLNELVSATEQQLTNQLRTLNLGSTVSPGVIHLSLDDYHWQQTLLFLRQGVFATKTATDNAWDDLGPSLLSHLDPLISLLRQPSDSSRQILYRLSVQLPVPILIKLLNKLPSDLLHRAMKHLLTDPRPDSALETYCHQYWQKRLNQQIANHNFDDIFAHWNNLLIQEGPTLVSALRRYARSYRLSELLIHDVDEPERLALLEQLEPDDYPFLSHLLMEASLWQIEQPAERNFSVLPSIDLSPRQVHFQLWLFTLNHLLIECGSGFNKQQYMRSLLTQMAATAKLTPVVLVNQLKKKLQRFSADSQLRQQMMTLISTISPSLRTQVETLSTVKPEQLRGWVRERLLQEQIAPHLTALLSHHRKLLAELILELTATPTLRERIFRQLPTFALRRLLPELDQTLTPEDIQALSDSDLKQHWKQITKTPDYSRLANLQALTDALFNGDELTLLKLWPTSTTPIFVDQVRWIGQLATVRHQWVSRYSEATLASLLELIEPRAKEVVALLYSASNTNVSLSGNSFWESAFEVLLVTPHRSFNGPVFLAQFIERLADANRTTPQKLISTLQQNQSISQLLKQLPALGKIPEAEPISYQLLPLLLQWQQRMVPKYLSLQSWQQLVNTLLAPSTEHWNALTQNGDFSISHELAELICQLGQQDNLRHRWAKMMNDQQRLTLVEWSVPQALQTVASIITNSQYFLISQTNSAINSIASIKQSLWEFTLDYLMVERGNAFHRRSYLIFLTQRLAAHYDLSHDQLIEKIQSLPVSNTLHQDPFWQEILANILNSSAKSNIEQTPNSETRHALESSTSHSNAGNILNVIAMLDQWLRANTALPDSLLLLLRHYPSAKLWLWLQASMRSVRDLTRWINAVDDSLHIELLCTHNPRLKPLITALLMELYQQNISVGTVRTTVFQTLYRQLLLRGYSGNSVSLWQTLLAKIISQLDRLSIFPTFNLPEAIQALLPIQWGGPESQPIQPFKAPAQLDPRNPTNHLLNELLSGESSSAKNSSFSTDEDTQVPEGTPIHISNAGLVLLVHYLPMLLQRLSLTNDRGFVGNEAQGQAVFCLHWISNGEIEAAEYQLTLNKLLCGIKLTSPIPRSASLPNGATEMMHGLLNALIGHWKALGNTSIEGLRSTFLQRDGELLETPEQWQLQVDSGPFDMLLDQLPWSFQTIRLPWMEKPLFVSWR